jgi:hypothetical protein
MKIQLIHPFLADERADWGKILKDVDSLAGFERRIKKFCDTDTSYLTEDEKGNKVRTFLGDAWEVFVEMLLKSHAYDRRIGVSHYKPHHRQRGDEDHGVDGSGVGTNGRVATVQAKFRGNPQDYLTANESHLSNFLSSSQNEYGVSIYDTENMLIVTNCKGLHYYTKEKMLFKKVKCCGRDAIQQFVDNNIPFWDEFRRTTSIYQK